MDEVSLQLLGGFRLLDVEGEPIEIRSRKSVASIAYLALQEEYTARRERLAALLWPSSATTQARASLRQVLYEIRGVVPEGILATTRETASLSGRRVEIDVDRFERLADEAELATRNRAAELYAGELLEGVRIDAPAFEQWLDEQRRRLHERVIGLLGDLKDAYEREGRFDRAIGTAVRLLSIDPVQESVHRDLMTYYMRRDQRGRALRQFQRCRDALRTQLGVSPASSTRELHRAIIQGTHPAEERESSGSEERELEAAHGTSAGGETAKTNHELPELRQVVVLSLEFEYDERLDPAERAGDPERVQEVLEAAGRLAKRTLVRYATTVLPRFGNEWTVVFGLRHATGTDARDAVDLALEIRGALQGAVGEVPVRLYAGATTGEVMVAGRGSDPGDVVGAAFSRAGRLRGAASAGEILVDEALREGVEHEFELAAVDRNLRSMQIDHCWSVSASAGSEESAIEGLIGRDRELGVAEALLERCYRRATGYAIRVVGEAGIGKSRLARSVRELAEPSGWSVHLARVPSDGLRGSEAFLRSLAESLVGLESTSGRDDRRAAVDALTAESILDDGTSVFLADLLGLERTSNAARTFDAMTPEARREGAAETLVTLLEHLAASGPTLVILEDLHWVDAAAARVVRRFLETTRRAPVVVVATSRLQGSPFEESIEISSIPSIEMRLTPLTSEQSLQLVRQYAGDATDSMLQTCVERGRGHPFFLQQLARLGDCAAPPADVRSLVLSITDDAPLAERRILRAASVLGPRFAAERLESMTGMQVDFDSDLSSRLLDSSEGTIAFVHDLARSAIYSSLIEEERTRLHRRAAATFEEDLAARARHLERAGSDEAPAACLEAARAELEDHRNERARRLLERGLRLVETSALEFELTCLLAEQLRILGEPRESIESYRSAVDLAGGPGERARARTGIVAGLRVLEEYDEASEELERAERAADQADDARIRADIEYYRGCIAFPRGNMTACVEAHEESLALAGQIDSPRRRARALGGLADAYYMQGRMGTARDYFDRCVNLARAHEFGQIEVANLHMRGLTELFHCNAREATDQIVEAAKRAGRVGDSRTEMVASTVLCNVLLVRRRWKSLRERAETATDLAARLGASRFRSLTRAFHGLAVSRLGRPGDGRDDLLASWRAVRDQGAEFHAAGVAGLCALGLSDVGERREFLQQGESALSDASLSHNFLLFFPLAMLTRWEIERTGATAYAERLAAHTDASPLPWTDFFVHWAAVADCDNPGEEDLSELADRIQASGFDLFSGPLSDASGR